MKKQNTQKGFTLVEIMIVVVIIGLLAAMAIPAFQKVRASSLEKTMLNDARQIGAAVQQYCMENGVTQASLGLNATNQVTGQLSVYLRQISPNITMTAPAAGANINGAGATNAFILSLPGAFGGTTVSFDSEGRKTN